MEERCLIEIHNQLTKDYETISTSNMFQKRILEKDIVIFLNDYRKVLLPEYFHNSKITLQELNNFKNRIENILQLTKYSDCLSAEDSFIILGKIPSIRSMVYKDIEAAFIKDPAAKSYEEVVITYPGVFAIMVHRISHELYKMGYFFFSRLLSEYSHSRTGIDMHPGATIGESFFHGSRYWDSYWRNYTDR